MSWGSYIAVFFAGVFCANGVPHFVQGICGNRFQTPLASPPGVGESSPLVNVLWGWLNFVIGGGLAHYFLPPLAATLPWQACAVSALGALLIAVFLSQHFGKVRGSSPSPR